jgi:hypothetical protein
MGTFALGWGSLLLVLWARLLWGGVVCLLKSKLHTRVRPCVALGRLLSGWGVAGLSDISRRASAPGVVSAQILAADGFILPSDFSASACYFPVTAANTQMTGTGSHHKPSDCEVDYDSR